MKKKKLIIKTVSCSVLAAAAYFPFANTVTICLYHHRDSDIEKYVQENFEQAVTQQEKKLGIAYPAERPKIEFLLPKTLISFGNLGAYNDVKDTIYLPSGFLTKPEWDLGDFLSTVFTYNSTGNVKRILDHELAHFYCDKVKEQALGAQYHLLALRWTDEEYIADELVNEGIAEYIENKMNGEEKKPFPLENWPASMKYFSNRVIYEGGYTLVKPIIDQHGEKGLQFLLFNIMTPDELYSPKRYQERILEDIAKLHH